LVQLLYATKEAAKGVRVSDQAQENRARLEQQFLQNWNGAELVGQEVLIQTPQEVVAEREPLE
jgi:hypothetical protein